MCETKLTKKEKKKKKKELQKENKWKEEKISRK